MGIVGVTVRSGQLLERSAVEAQLAAHILAGLFQLDEDIGLGHRAIGAAQVLVRRPDEAARPDPGRPGTPAFQLGETVDLGAARPARDAVGRRPALRQRRRRNVIVVGILLHPVDVDGDRTEAEGQPARGRPSVVNAGRLGRDQSLQALGHLGRNTVVDHIDHAADGRAAIGEGGRAAHDLDAVGLGGVGRDLVVGRHRTGINQADAIGQDLHARAAQAADHRAAGTGGEVGRADARQAVDQVAQRRRRRGGQRLLVNDRGGDGRGPGADSEWRAGDDDVVQRDGRIAGILRGHRLGRGGPGQGTPSESGHKGGTGDEGEGHERDPD